MKSPLTTSLCKQTTISKRLPDSFARTGEAYHILPLKNQNLHI